MPPASGTTIEPAQNVTLTIYINNPTKVSAAHHPLRGFFKRGTGSEAPLFLNFLSWCFLAVGYRQIRES